MIYWWRRRESNLSPPFRFCNLLILQTDESAKKAYISLPIVQLSYNFICRKAPRYCDFDPPAQLESHVSVRIEVQIIIGIYMIAPARGIH